VVVHKVNGGLSDARNVGLKIATGDYVLYVDSDDYIELDACEKLMDGAIDGVDFVAGSYYEVKGSTKVAFKHHGLANKGVYDPKGFIIPSIQHNEWYAPAWLNLYNRSFLIENSLFFKKGIYYEDFEMLPRIFLKARKIAYVDYAFYNYIIRDNSIMTSEKTPKKEMDSFSNYKAWKEYFDLVSDKELQRYLYGILVRYYLKTCRVFGIKMWMLEGVDFEFALRYALNFKEKAKILFFQLAPYIYVKLKKD